jgi:hypothetical protein
VAWSPYRDHDQGAGGAARQPQAEGDLHDRPYLVFKDGGGRDRAAAMSQVGHRGLAGGRMRAGDDLCPPGFRRGPAHFAHTALGDRMATSLQPRGASEQADDVAAEETS